jgi:hypothetical protein
MAFFASFADKLSGTSTLTRLLGFNGCGTTMTLYDIASLDGRKEIWGVLGTAPARDLYSDNNIMV